MNVLLFSAQIRFNIDKSIKFNMFVHFRPIVIGSPTTKLNAWKNCEYCTKKFLTKSKLIDHIKNLHNELIFHCEMCDGYVARIDLIAHMTHHALFPSIVPPTIGSSKPPVQPIRTALPSTTNAKHPRNDLGSPKFVSWEFQDIAPIPQISPKSVTPPPIISPSITSIVPPAILPKSSDASSSINGSPQKTEDRLTISNGSSSKENHLPKKPKVTNHQCHLCEKQFADRTGLRYHIKHFHEKIKNFHCDMCDKRFSCKRIILNHIRGVHIKEKIFACDQCPKVFKVDSALYMHKKSHDDKYLYFCKICDGKFKSRTQLNVHLTMHTKEKNYFCTLCNKGFAVRNNLTKHLRTHSSSFDFKCHICSYAANQRRYLQEHMKRAHQTVLPSNNC